MDRVGKPNQRRCECGRVFTLAEGSVNVRCQQCLRWEAGGSPQQAREAKYERRMERRHGSGPSDGWEGRL